MKILLALSVLVAVLQLTSAVAVEKASGIAARGMSVTADCAQAFVVQSVVCSVPIEIALDQTYRQFETAKAIMAANSAAINVTRDQWLNLYGWESQGTIGNIQSSRPWYWNRNAVARWDAWKDDFGMSCDQARSKYVQEALKIIAAKSTKEDASRWINQIEVA